MIKIANAPCSWGVLEFDLQGEAASYAQVLDEIEQTGYEGTELGDWGFMPTDPAKLKNELNARSLEMLGAFVPVAFADYNAHQNGADNALRIAELLAATGESPFIILADNNGTNEVRTKNAGRIKKEQGLTDDQWKIFAEGVEKIASLVKEKHGLRTVVHHHCAGYVETPGEVEKLLSLTDPELVGLCLDTGHYRFGGGDPIQALKKYFGRIRHVHFKDCEHNIAVQSRENNWDYFESVKNGIFCELGKGEIDFKSVLEELRNLNYDGWIVVEQDVLPGMGSPKVCAENNRKYLKSIGI